MSAARSMHPLAAATVALTASASAALGQSKVGTALGEFLLIESSARVAGMGNAGVSLDRGLDAAYYNPAASARLERREVVFSHSAWLADITHDYVALGIPMGRWGNAYASVTSLSSGDIDVRTETQPLGTGERFRVTDVAIGIGYGKEITDRFSVGGQVTWFQETIWHSAASSATLSVGTLYRIADQGLHIGSSLSHFGTAGRFSGRDLRITYDNDPTRYGDNGALPGERFTDRFAVPVLFRVGLGLPLQPGPGQRLLLAVDAHHPSENEESLRAGAEWAWRERVALRAGWQNALQPESETGLTFGGGLGGALDERPFKVDYAWADHGRLGSTHRLTFGVEF